MEIITQLIGRLHPIIVHLPIGFLVSAVLLFWVDRKRRQYSEILARIFLWSGCVSILACISGYLLYRNEGYGFATIKSHMWFGIVTAAFCFLLYLKWKSESSIKVLARISFSVLIFTGLILVSVTGHKGGNITHGEGYLTEPLPRGFKKALGISVFEKLPITLTSDNWEKADFYSEVVHPILNNKCVACHGPKQAKGELRLDEMDGILLGGKNGAVLHSQGPESSELYLRTILSMEEDGHMPPKEKEQLTKEEIEILNAWIKAGHPFNGTIESLGMKESLFKPFFLGEIEELYPKATMQILPLDSLIPIKETGLHVEYISKESPWLRVSAINKPDFTLVDTLTLSGINDFIVELNLSNTAINDSIYPYLGHLPNLTILNLGGTEVSDQGIEYLSSLKNLKYLNLTHTGISQKAMEKLVNFPALRKVYVFGTTLSKPSNGQVTGKLVVDYGGYQLPKIDSDTIIY